MTKVIHPIGWEAGRELNIAESLNMLAIEFLGHRSDLGELGEDNERTADLERIAVCLQSLALQLDPDRWKAGSFGGLLEMARKHGITLPDWMAGE